MDEENREGGEDIVSDLKAGAELDAAVAQEVMEWESIRISRWRATPGLMLVAWPPSRLSVGGRGAGSDKT